jgi:hypothetical protein
MSHQHPPSSIQGQTNLHVGVPTPGVFWVAAKIINPELTPEVLKKWYDEVHFPDIIKTSGMKTTFRYNALDPKADRPFFYYYPVRDLAFLQSEEFFKIPITIDLLPGPSHMIFDFVDFDTRYYELVQTYEPEGTKHICLCVRSRTAIYLTHSRPQHSPNLSSNVPRPRH